MHGPFPVVDSVPKMTPNPDCIVVGGGLIGMLTARELAVAGLGVRVLERGALGQEASWAGGGILSPLYPWRYDDAVNRLAAWGQPRYQALAEALTRESGLDPEWTPSGMLVLDAGDEPRARTWAEQFGARMQAVEPAQVLEPGLGIAPTSALWMPAVAQVRNPRLVRALAGSLAHHGVAVEENAPVEELLVERGRVRGVVAGGRRWHSDRVVVAGGAWSAALLGRAAVSVPVEPVRGQMLVFRAEPGLVRHIVLWQDRYLIPRRDGHVLIGSTLERVGFDKGVTEEAERSLWETAVRLVPQLRDQPVERHWSGLRPGAPGGLPFIGKVQELSGLFVNTGHFRNGVVLGPASARLLTDLVLERPPIVDPSPYSPDRAASTT